MTMPSSGGVNGPLRNQTRTTLASSSPIRSGQIPVNDASPQEPKGSNWSYLMLLLPVLCCGGPFIVLALGSIGTAALGIAGGIVVALAAAIGIFVVRRRKSARCCSASSFKERS